MSGRTEPLGRAVAFLLVACVLGAALAPAGLAGGVGGDPVERASADDAVSYAERDSASRPSEATDAVGPGLRSATGTVEVVVRFDGGPESGSVSHGGDERRVSTDDLRTAAQRAQADFERFAERNPGVTVERSFWLANAMLVTVDTDGVAVERLLEVRGVERVHENFKIEVGSATPRESDASAGAVAGARPRPTVEAADSTAVNATYGVETVRAPEVWREFDARGEGATVAVLDTGIDPDHPDLAVSGWARFDDQGNLVNDSVDDASDADGHGTHVAGTVAGGNASGTAIGVAPDAELYGYKVLDDEGAGTFARVVGGMEYAANDSTVDVVQMSLGAEGQFDGFIEPVQNARSAGKVVIASAGNDGSGTSSSPGNVYESFAVGAVDESEAVAEFSGGETLNTSEDWSNETLTADWPDEYLVPDASAPGVSVYSARPGGTYGEESGTSMAAPHVSGVAALMLSASARNVTDDELYDTLRETAAHPDGADPDTRYGAGIVDGYAAVSSVSENRSNLTVTAFDAPNETATGATVEATATVNNTGADPGTGTVEYRFNGSVGDRANVSLAPGEETTVSLSYVVPDDTPTNRTYGHGAYTSDSNLTAEISVVDGPFYEVTNLSAPGIAERNATLDATADVTNRGEAAGENRSVELRLAAPGNESDVRVLNATNVSLDAGNATTLALSGTVPDDVEPGATTVSVASPDDDETASVRVAEAVGTVNGTVTDAATNATLAGIDVVVRNGTEVVGEAGTGGDGTYAVDVPAANLTVTGSNATYAPSSATANLSGSGDVATANLSLSLRNGTLSGVVGASDGLAPPEDATVGVTNETGVAVATRDVTDGTFAVSVRPGTYNLTADASDFEQLNATNVTVAPNATTDLTLALDPLDASLSGTVSAESSGDPIDGATVTVGSTSNATDAGGNYSLTSPRGEYDATATAPGYGDASGAVVLAANGSREIDFVLPPEFAVADLSGPSEIEQGASGDFTATVRNNNGSAGDVTVTFADGATGTQRSKSFSGVAADATRSATFTVSVADDRATGSYDATASTPDDSRTVSFEVTEPDGDGGDDGSTGGGGGGSAGGGGGSGGGSGTGDDGGGDTGDDTTEDDETAEEPGNETDEVDRDDPVNGTEDDLNDTEDGPGERDTVDDPDGDGTDDESGGDGTGDGGAADGESAEDEATEDTNDDAPGFGTVAALLALVVAATLSRRSGGD